MGTLLAMKAPTMRELATEKGPVVSVQNGQLRGARLNGVVSFKGVPYAANPFTARTRFKAPRAVTAWDGVRDAMEFRRPPPQPGRDTLPTLLGGFDDLTLNIWTPDTAATGLPVMVWIPGGAFIRADASEAVYDGTGFAADGVVCVTVNYRVGVDGFMAIEGAPDNRGILDQIAALEWVRDNIAAFGGDPVNVTLFGQSAGAESVGILLASPRTEGLFGRAILQSPPMQSVTAQEATRLAKTLAGMLRIRPTIADLSNVSLEALTSAAVGLNMAIKDRTTWGRLSLGGTAFLPVVDGVVLDASPLAMLARDPKPGVPVIVGSTDQEARLYLIPDGEIDRITTAVVDQFVADLKLPADTIELYRQNPANSTIGDVYSAMQSDYTFRVPALRIAEDRSRTGAAWHYNFAWKSPAFGGRLGAAHFVDVPFAFKMLASDQARTFVGDDPPATLADGMHMAWVAFAKTGGPGWPAYNCSERVTMRFDSQSDILMDPERSTRLIWQDIKL